MADGIGMLMDIPLRVRPCRTAGTRIQSGQGAASGVEIQRGHGEQLVGYIGGRERWALEERSRISQKTCGRHGGHGAVSQMEVLGGHGELPNSYTRERLALGKGGCPNGRTSDRPSECVL